MNKASARKEAEKRLNVYPYSTTTRTHIVQAGNGRKRRLKRSPRIKTLNLIVWFPQFFLSSLTLSPCAASLPAWRNKHLGKRNKPKRNENNMEAYEVNTCVVLYSTMCVMGFGQNVDPHSGNVLCRPHPHARRTSHRAHNHLQYNNNNPVVNSQPTS